jgi:hypothetical protein
MQKEGRREEYDRKLRRRALGRQRWWRLIIDICPT